MHLTFTENQIDGAGFLDLTEPDIKELIKPLGIVKKIVRLKKQVHTCMYTIKYCDHALHC